MRRTEFWPSQPRVAAGEVAQGADGGLRMSSCRPHAGWRDERLHTTVLRNQRLVLAVVARQVGQSARGTGEDADIGPRSAGSPESSARSPGLLGVGESSGE